MPNYHFEDETVGMLIEAIDGETEVQISVPGREELDHSALLSPGAGPYNFPTSSSLIHQNTAGPINTVLVRSDMDIAVLVYNMAPFTSDIYTAMPMKYAGDEYFVSLISRERGSHPLFSGILEISSLDGVASIEIHLTSTITFQNATSHFGDIFRHTLLPFESIQLLPPFTNITGSRILSNASILVSAGSKCADVPQEVGACDHLAEQLAPFKSWGKVFVVSPIAGRPSGYLLQVVAGRDNTRVSIGVLNLELSMGEYDTIDVTTQEMKFLTSNNPISIMQYSKGTRIDGKGDPSMSRVVPNEQFVSEAFFPVHRFQSNMSTINTTYLEITTDCEYVNSVSLSRNGEDIQPSVIEEYSLEIGSGSRMCTRWSEIAPGSYSVRSRDVTLPDGQRVYPRFRAVVSGYEGVSESYLYRAASDDRELTCSSQFTDEFDCPGEHD
ncbi:uncharacterized protein LOC121427960 [Lytechinus variegatus]|uniref:uncharacterized protein LOC121427960 n=1 Tax=Lytechinus variegatus TaxID=7654 RepID=UPI001BB2A54E|nr:uncharacterized protein LOC121427960 [Lytechinus variegatus]